MPVILSAAVSVAIGYMVVDLLWPRKSVLKDWYGAKICISVGTGSGILSCVFFVFLVLSGSVKKYFIIYDFILLVICFVFYMVRKGKIFKEYENTESGAGNNKKINFITITAVAVLLITLASFILRILHNPHGSWDAWNIYTLGARFIYRGGAEWTAAFANPHHWTLPDYPLLLQGNIARFWNYSGHETMLAPSILAFQYTFASVFLMITSISMFSSKKQGIIAGIVLLGMPVYLFQGACLVADVPLGFFILALIVMYCAMDKIKDNNYGLVLLCGITAGFAAWTKNEGFILVISVPFARFFTMTRHYGLKCFLKETGVFIAGLLPIFIIILYYKLNVSSPEVLYMPPELASPLTPIFNQDIKTLINSLTDISKYMLIVKVFAVKIYEIGNWLLVVLPIYFILQGRVDKKRLKSGFYTSILILLIMISGYFTAFLAYPLDNLEWLMETTVLRLFIQILPGILFIFFFFTAAPGEIFSRKDGYRCQGDGNPEDEY